MILEKAKQLQIKHVIQITVCVLGVYLLRNKQAYQFVPSWRKDADLAHYGNNQFPAPDERLPSPVVSDVDGDGEVDIVFITSDGMLQVTKFRKSESVSKRLPHLEVMYSCNILEGSDNSDVEQRPVIMEAGYLDQHQDSKQRTQVIVITYNNWRVQCYDHKLQLLWQRTLLDIGASLSQHALRSMAVMVTPHKLHPTDRGLIVVGASLTHKGHAHSVIDDEEDDEPVRESDDDSDDDDVESSAFSRFSTFALSGLNGTLKWQHLPHVMNKATEMEEEIHHWKLSLRRGSWSHSDRHWLKYGRYLFRHMPHQWHHLKDTKFDLADLHQIQEDRKSASLPPSASPLDDLGTSHLIGLAFGGLRPHSRHEHVNNPSAVVVHNDKGLELLSLFNGQLITGLALEQHTAVYGDINSDGKLDQVLVKLADACQGEASTVHPRPRTLFVVDICSTGWWSEQDNSNTENKHTSVPPIIVKSVSRPHGLVNHLLGKALPTERKGFDSIFITSSGYVSSFDPFGNKNWQVQTKIKWSNKIKFAENPKYRYTPEGRVLYNAFTPSMLPLALQMYGPQTHAIISGWNNIILVDLEDGYVAAEHSLPCPPIEAPVLADFDGDGWTDVIIYCPNGYVGMSIHTQPQYVYMTVLSVTIVLFMLLLSWCSQVD